MAEEKKKAKRATKKSAAKKSAPKKKSTPKKKSGAKKKAPAKKATPKKKSAAKKKAPAKKSPSKKKSAVKKKAPAKKPAVKRKSVAKKKAPAQPRIEKQRPSPSTKEPTFHLMGRLIKTWLRRLSYAAILSIVLFFLLSTLWVYLYRTVNPPITWLMVQRSIQSEKGEGEIQKIWRDYDAISPHFALAVLCAEDQRFPDHNGFDTVELRRAIENRRQGKALRGASTLSQQLAKNLFLWNSRSYVRKGMEVWFTFLLESFYTKERILELYLNVAEMGQGIYGAEAASLHYFEKPSSELTKQEAALLAVILPNPRERDPRNPTPYLMKRQQWVLQQMWNLGGEAYLKKIESP